MSRLKQYTDPFVIADSQYKLSSYVMKSEVKDWVTSECKDDHIFVHALIVANLVELDKDCDAHKVYDLSVKLIESFDEDLADELIDLVEKLPDDMTDLFEYVSENY